MVSRLRDTLYGELGGCLEVMFLENNQVFSLIFRQSVSKQLQGMFLPCAGDLEAVGVLDGFTIFQPLCWQLLFGNFASECDWLNDFLHYHISQFLNQFYLIFWLCFFFLLYFLLFRFLFFRFLLFRFLFFRRLFFPFCFLLLLYYRFLLLKFVLICFFRFESRFCCNEVKNKLLFEFKLINVLTCDVEFGEGR